MISVNLTGAGNTRLFWRAAASYAVTDTPDKTAFGYQPGRLLIDAVSWRRAIDVPPMPIARPENPGFPPPGFSFRQRCSRRTGRRQNRIEPGRAEAVRKA